MNQTSTIISIPAQARVHVSGIRTSCWCGQDLEHVQRSHCPRCGRSVPRSADR